MLHEPIGDGTQVTILSDFVTYDEAYVEYYRPDEQNYRVTCWRDGKPFKVCVRENEVKALTTEGKINA